ncbi:MAG TPA: glycosyltransferase family 1 protein [Solirubrobacterales bacterium]|nr:glycosyltransferase family 1 protein [Solirubrobacterales bacterium]
MAPGSVWLDARGTQSAAHGERGVARYVAEHTKALVDLAPEAIGAIGLDRTAPIPPSMRAVEGSGLISWHRTTRAAGHPVPGTYHVMSPFEMIMDLDEVWPAWIRQSEARLVVTLYDLIPLVMREDYLSQSSWGAMGTAWLARLGLIRTAQQVLTISQRTADDAMERLSIPEERITVIDSGVSVHHSSLVATREEAVALLQRQRPRIRAGFLLYVGGDDARKNMEGTIRGYAQLPAFLRREHQLVIVCRIGPLRRFELRTFARSLGIENDEIALTGFVTEEELAALYRSCALFIFPSLYEGAGLPILEAMSCDAPVAASNTSSIPELLGDREGTFDPADPADIARGLGEVLVDPAALERLRERSRRRLALHTWERVARRTVEGYERAGEVPLRHLRRNGHGPRPRRKRLALVTPWSSDGSAAAYSRRLVGELVECADVDVVVPVEEQGPGPESPEDPRLRILSEDEFAWRRGLRGYDRCLYVLGGGPGHLPALESVLKLPGIALVHDVRLLPLYVQMHRRRFLYDPYWLENKLIEMYGDRIPRDYLLRVPYDHPEQNRTLSMTREVQSHAQRVLVHSRRQAEIMRLERPDEAAPTEIVPRAIPETPSSDPARSNGRAGLISIGPSNPKLREALGRLDAGLANPVAVLTDGADAGAGEWDAVCDCIAARIPVVAAGAGWSEEFPPPVVLPIAPECTAVELAERIAAAAGDGSLRDQAREAQNAYAARNSFARVAERYAELLEL